MIVPLWFQWQSIIVMFVSIITLSKKNRQLARYLLLVAEKGSISLSKFYVYISQFKCAIFKSL